MSLFSRSGLALSVAFALTTTVPWAGENCEHHSGGKAEAKAMQGKEIKGGTKDHASYMTKFPEIKRSELTKLIEAKQVVLVDANGSESYSKGHLPGAIDLEATADLASVLPTDRNALIVAYCGGPGCKAWCKAADKLEELGYTNVKHYKGGIKEWKASGLALEKPAATSQG